jgi:acyl-CoA ligase (AMP-forming) (exosortase A-associated)
MYSSTCQDLVPIAPVFVDEILAKTCAEQGNDIALIDAKSEISYGALNELVDHGVSTLRSRGFQPRMRVAIRADKSIKTVASFFAVWRAGCILIPINPNLKEEQIEYILNDCSATLLKDTAILPEIVDFPDQAPFNSSVLDRHENEAACILYTSGSTGMPKGVILSHRNLVAGCASVVTYLANTKSDRILALLPLSFDAGLSQVTTGFMSGATVVLHHYLLPQDCLRVMESRGITGLTAVPPVWIQLSKLSWPTKIEQTLRYFANTGGRMPLTTLNLLRSKVPQSRPFLMYGLTEAFRSTYLAPDQIEIRPHSIGKAIPNARVLVLRPDGSECAVDEPGELVHIGPTVTLGYWNDPERTAQRFRQVPNSLPGAPLSGLAVWSGDTVTRDAEGYLYFVGRTDEMIKTSGYRVSPTEVEEAVYRTGLLTECLAYGTEDFDLGQAIHLIGFHADVEDPKALCDTLKQRLRDSVPVYMIPRQITLVSEPLSRNANGKLDRNKIISLARR